MGDAVLGHQRGALGLPPGEAVLGAEADGRGRLRGAGGDALEDGVGARRQPRAGLPAYGIGGVAGAEARPGPAEEAGAFLFA